jgi:hypothetical protein
MQWRMEQGTRSMRINMVAHTIMILTLTQRESGVSSSLFLVDLAGSGINTLN